MPNTTATYSEKCYPLSWEGGLGSQQPLARAKATFVQRPPGKGWLIYFRLHRPEQGQFVIGGPWPRILSDATVS